MCLLSRIRAVLRQSPLPISTPDIVLLCGHDYPNARGQVWAMLSRLRRAGEIMGVFGEAILPHPALIGGATERRQRVQMWVLARGVS